MMPAPMPLRPFGFEETHGILGRRGVRIKACSDGRSWTSLYASVQDEAPFYGVFNSTKDHLLVLHRGGPVRIENAYDNQVSSTVVPPGAIHLVSPGVRFGVRLGGEVETVHVYLRRSVLEDVGLDMVDADPSRIEVPSIVVKSDPILRSLMEAAAGAVEADDDNSSVFADYIARAMAVQLIRAYASVPLRPTALAANGGRISQPVSRAIEYMKDHLGQPISLEDLSRATSQSPSRIARLFRTEIGDPPHRHLVGLRIEKARQLLLRTDLPVAEIAYACGFSHQEHLTRWFRRTFQTTPAAYRRAHRVPS